MLTKVAQTGMVRWEAVDVTLHLAFEQLITQITVQAFIVGAERFFLALVVGIAIKDHALFG